MGIKVTRFQQGHVNKKKEFLDGYGPGGAWCIRGEITNTGRRTISRIILYMKAYDKNDHIARCTESHETEKFVIIAGPMAANVTKKFSSGILWKNPDIYKIRVTSADVEYTDGYQKTFQRADMTVERRKSDGCYIATSVYGSYDCPEVWTLRRFRDQVLGKSMPGRMFIRFYYAVSPGMVKAFGHRAGFQKIWKNYLDRKVKRLKKKGFSDLPYEDVNWRVKE